MKLIKKIQKKEDKKIQFSSLRASRDREYFNNEPASDPLEPFAWRTFFEEALKMGMKLDMYTLTRTNFKIPPMPAVVSENAMFGVSLDEIMERQKKISMESNIPNIVDQCIQYLYKYGLKEIGLFQSSSIDCEKVKKMRESIDAGDGVEVQLHEHLKYIDVHTVAGTLKQYLREFPQPIIPSDVFDMLIASAHRGSEEVRKAIHLLPRNSYNLLDKLFFLFSEICKNESYNDIDAPTLAESFGPVLMWRNAITGGVDINRTREITNSFIVNYTTVFSKGAPLRPVIGQGLFQPTGLTKSASLSTLSPHTPTSLTPSPSFSSIPPSPSSRFTPKPPLSLSSSPSSASSPSNDPSRSSAEAPQTNYMVEIYRNMKKEEKEGERDVGSDEEGEEEEKEVRERKEEVVKPRVPPLPYLPSAPNFARNSRDIFEENRGEEEEWGRKEKGKMPMGRGGGGGGMMMKKSASENLANKYGGNQQQQKKGSGFGFFKKIELKKKT